MWIQRRRPLRASTRAAGPSRARWTGGARTPAHAFRCHRQGFASPLPEFVRSELEGYLHCGVLARGFALLACPDCGEHKLVAFSCDGRGFCPSCFGRRMAQSAANLVDHVLPEGVPLRQYVLKLSFELRARIAYDRELMGGVGRIFVGTVLGFYARKTRERGISRGQSGVFTVMPRTNSDLKCNAHYHTVFLDGVFAPAANTKLEFHPLGSLSNTELGDLMQAVRIPRTRLSRPPGSHRVQRRPHHRRR
jgi:hypothetical protein